MAHQTAGFEQLVQETIEEWKVPGLSIAKCTEDTLFDLASTSKSTTSAAIACLIDDEAYPDVQWTTPVSKLLPDDFVLADPEYTKNVTIEDILSHRTGLPGHDDSYLGVRAEHPDDAKSMTRNLRNLPLSKPLRTTYQYSNIMYTVATHLVETLSGKSYAEFLRIKLWEPLGMSNTYHDLPGISDATAKQRLATGYRWDKKNEEYIEIPSFPQPEGQGAGSIFSSAADYAKWIRALLKCKAPFSAEAHKNLITPRTIVPLEEPWVIPYYSHSLYALGLIVETYRGRTVVGHDGDVNGFKAVVRYMPEFDWGIVILGNSDGAFGAEQILLHMLMDHVVNVPEEERLDWTKFWREWGEREEAEAEEDEDEDDVQFQTLENPEVLGVPIHSLAGKYYNAGYKGLVLEMKEGKLVADCNDRCWPFVLTFSHLPGGNFAVKSESVWGGDTKMMKAEFRIEEGRKVESVGVNFVEEIQGHLTWFDKVT
ncbi:beta-lactamase/transpeptidase-like protein [Cucurbitaria berberidis CBS 394.84]|uniref:Beta-lactamase/transpeptidase-like protein n=1 Tax=Cucurbitaria berberidis CBS 394.84 TaxID=1168544 RepID=A0A9P4L6T7_9PLEO|nr:beta-lactamase/transpeptidase-like protein [Cucurbitaria berberidis CBS 394.84]KAF1844311.1 beta-lactamase/transpeptidase-like protein [Cucurbitaria berberidis CBS 394.84]